MRHNFNIYLITLSAILLVSCNSNQLNKGSEIQENKQIQLPENISVTTMILQQDTFMYDIVSNGTIRAGAFSDLSFKSTEVINTISVKNGEFVKRGELIAKLEDFTLHNNLELAKSDLAKSELEMQDLLIGQGYIGDLDSVPESVLKLAQVKSGYDRYKSLCNMAQYELDCAVLVAPFDGIVANLTIKEHNRANNTVPFCRIIDNKSMEVEFTILESELLLVKVGDAVEVSPYSLTDTGYKGKISEINPIVNAGGAVNVKARLYRGGDLYDGMNVRVKVKRTLHNQLVIPKSALVVRSNKEVVFTLKGDKVEWNYVKSGHENMEECTIIEGLQQGMEVIISENENLAHGTVVNVKK